MQPVSVHLCLHLNGPFVKRYFQAENILRVPNLKIKGFFIDNYSECMHKYT